MEQFDEEPEEEASETEESVEEALVRSVLSSTAPAPPLLYSTEWRNCNSFSSLSSKAVDAPLFFSFSSF